MKWWNQIKQKPGFIKLTQWEYWPSLAFYWPMFFYGPYLAIRPKHICFFTPANPGLEGGGMCMESKFHTLEMFPEALCPESVFVPNGTPTQDIEKALDQTSLTFPMIVKPNVGFRGLLVKKVDNFEQLSSYIHQYPIDFLIQEFLQYPEEVGVFYSRMPDEEKGKIISLTLKEFLHVVGDGQSTVAELVENNPRALLQMERLQEMYADLLVSVPAPGEKVNLGVVGNHSKGTLFINGNDQIDAALTEEFDRLARHVDGFYYGRFDIKCQSLDDLRQGKNFKIIELNGVFAEPTHIYDSTKISYFEALRTIIRHWKLVQEISFRNAQKGVAPMPVPEMLKVVKSIRDYGKLIKRFSS
ncbi:MAG TPA: hypothetical protein VJ953_19540 [Saprospiraceae bacterium]|nr:hypothetical protein [Saprospiraceae bacterium]